MVENKIIITENQKLKMMVLYRIEAIIPENFNIEYYYDGEEVNPPDNISYIDAISIVSDDYEPIMKIYLSNYWYDGSEKGIEMINKSPILVLDTYYREIFEGMFGESLWKEPLLLWFKYNVQDSLDKKIEIKTVE